MGKETSFICGGENFFIGTASVDQLEQVFDVYPNPTTGTIKWNTDAIRSVAVIYVNGKQLLKKQLDVTTQELSLETIENGIYLVAFELTNGTTIQQRILLLKD